MHFGRFVEELEYTLDRCQSGRDDYRQFGKSLQRQVERAEKGEERDHSSDRHLAVHDHQRARPDNQQRRAARDELGEHLMSRGKFHALDSQIVKLGGALMEPAGLVGLARKRFHRPDAGDALLQLAGKFLDHFLKVVTGFLDSWRKNPDHRDVKWNDYQRNPREPRVEIEEQPYDEAE